MFFSFGKKKEKKNKEESRDIKLSRNENIPFTKEIVDDMQSASLAYKYDKVQCSIIGDVSGLKEGAILYPRRNGVLANVCKEEVAQIDNKKIQRMVNDFFDKDRFVTLRAKFVSLEEGFLFCNLGFFVDDEPNEETDDDED